MQIVTPYINFAVTIDGEVHDAIARGYFSKRGPLYKISLSGGQNIDLLMDRYEPENVTVWTGVIENRIIPFGQVLGEALETHLQGKVI